MKTVYPKEKIESQIGFDYVKSFLSQHCVSDFARNWVADLRPFDSPKDFGKRLDEVNDFLKFTITLGKTLNIYSWNALTERLNQCKIKGFYLDIEEILDVRDFLSQSISIFKQINAYAGAFSALIPYTHDISNLSSVQKLIDEVINHKGKIRENASPLLQRLNKQKLTLENQLLSTLNKVFSKLKKEKLSVELEPTVKNGRYVIPVPSAYRKQIKGVVQGESGSKNVSYIEPMEVLEANNSLNQVLFEIDEEVSRLLILISERIGEHVNELYYAESKLGFVDFLNAVSKYASQFKAVIPKISKEHGNIQIKQGRHPKLESNLRSGEIVPLDFDFSEEERIMIISGPNAGGKSVALKTFSLAQYSLQCALPVCAAEGSTMILFDHMLTDIGDNQSIESDLSTYSAHLTAMRAFLEPKKGKVFIAVDEIGAGTDPQLGGPMAEAMIQQFNSSHYYGIITTHFSNLKSLSSSLEHVFNASMLYDTDALKPLFKLVIGNPGSSFVFELSKRIGIPNGIIKQAKSLAGDNKQQLETYLSEMDSKKSALHKAEKEWAERNNNLEALVKEYENLKSGLVKSKKEILDKAKAEANEILRTSNKQIEKTIKRIKEDQAKKKTVIHERREIQKKKEQMEDLKHLSSSLYISSKGETKKVNWKVGDLASIDNETQAVEVIEIKNKKAIVVMDSIKTEVPIKRLFPVERKHESKSKGNVTQVLMNKMSKFNPKLDLRGKREYEAMQVLRTFLDEAYALGINELSVIHGRGDGALKRSTKALLKTLAYIKEWKHDHADRGGDGATLISLN